MSKPVFIFFGGLIASGKTTRARQLAKDRGAVLFSIDDWIERFENPIQEGTRFHRPCREIIAELSRDLLRLGVSVVLDFAGSSKESRRWARSIFESAGADHELHYVTTSREICRERLAARNEARKSRFVAPDHFDRSESHPPAPDEGFKVIEVQV